MGINLFKKKPKIQRVVVYAKITETSNYYITQDFWANKIKIVERRRYRRMQTVEEAKKELKEYRESILYIKEQQEDIEELSNMFKDMLGQSKEDEDTAYLMELEAHFVPQEDFSVTYLFMIDGKKKPLTIEVQNDELQVHYGQGEKIDVYTKLSPEVMDGIIQGRMTFQRAFMTGEMTAKGNLKNLKMLDQIFRF